MIPRVGRVSRPKAASENAPLLYVVQERVRAWLSKGELLPMCDPSSLVGPTQGGRGLRAAVLDLILRSPSRYAVGNNAKKVWRNFVMANYILNFSQVSLVLAPHAVIVLNRLYYLKVRVGCASAMPFLSSIGYSEGC
ncbi:hypothetical protein M404DRAFT_1004617 [Pisolithus tinctorius Marx 270]|uniref:Uncharacterized protein n=1 Tax=Pisolithus tinctorius Marx 270 TaxID=870435 RepID=A0A0C3IRG0_PISTI|nr:hypothetical protein M404DRAFT_1004617 [Pisolithus tinctorius Marx 270]